MIRIALDAMGGDNAPGEIVKGGVQAARDLNLEMILVGKSPLIEEELSKHDVDGLAISIVPASEVVDFEEQPVQAVRQKPDASIVVATRLVKDGKADAVVTAGHTGAAMVASIFTLGCIEGVERPAAGTTYLGIRKPTFFLDGGLNTDCKPEYLAQFAVMGTAYAERIMGIENPAVALISNGAEDNKGNQASIEAFKLLKRSSLNFIGNVEGMDIPGGRADVIVADGFVGNVAAKLSEGLMEALLDIVEEKVGARMSAGERERVLMPAMAELREMTDYQSVGGGLVLGLNGVAASAHGRSTAKAMVSIIELAKWAVENGLVSAIREGCQSLGWGES